MILIKPSYKILGKIKPAEIMQSTEAAGRTCYKSETNITEDSANKFVAKVIKRGHESVIEHEKISVRIVCDRGVSHELVRHRLCSFSQESTRYCDYNDGHISFVIPPWVSAAPGIYENIRDEIYSTGDFNWATAMSQAEGRYKVLRHLGWKPEQARSVLPNSLKTEIVITANLREWRLIFKLRTESVAHPQMREIARPMLDEFKELLPVIFEDIAYD